MKDELLQLLREPGTGAPLHVVQPEVRDGEIWAGVLRSEVTGCDYPIRAGIPRFVPGNDYTESFALQWNRFSTVQLDSANGADYSRRRFLNETRWSSDDLDGRFVLDAGCGSGRFAEIAAETGARVIALDYSSAVDAAKRNLAHLSNVHYVQGDVLAPPFAPGSLDFAYSIGVIQHTPDPPAAIAHVLRLLRPLGRFALTIYARRWYTRLYSKYLLRPLTRQLPADALLGYIEQAMPVAFPVTDVLYRVPAVHKLFQFAIPVANYTSQTELTREQRYAQSVLDTFDMLSPAFDRPMTAGEVEAILQALGVTSFTFGHRVPIEVTGSVPAWGLEAGSLAPVATSPGVSVGPE